MRKILILLVFVVGLPVLSLGQKLDISIGGGFSYNKIEPAINTKVAIYPAFNASACYVGLPHVSFGVSYLRSKFDKLAFNNYSLISDVNFGKKTIFSVGASLGYNTYEKYTITKTPFQSENYSFDCENSISFGLRLQLKRKLTKNLYIGLLTAPSYSKSKYNNSLRLTNYQTALYTSPVLLSLHFTF